MTEIVNPILETGDRSQTLGEVQNVHYAYRLNGNNYLKWSQLIRTILKRKGTVNHIIGNAHDEKDVKFKTWNEEGNLGDSRTNLFKSQGRYLNI